MIVSNLGTKSENNLMSPLWIPWSVLYYLLIQTTTCWTDNPGGVCNTAFVTFVTQMLTALFSVALFAKLSLWFFHFVKWENREKVLFMIPSDLLIKFLPRILPQQNPPVLFCQSSKPEVGILSKRDFSL